MAEIKTIYNAINESNTMKRYVDLRDIKIESRDDLLKTCQVFRNPKFETFRIIYMRDNVIINYESITSKLPNSCDVFRVKAKNPYLKNIKGFEDINRRMYRLGANGYYLEHNHPSGNAKASIEDMILTERLSKNVKGFKGHIIVNHGTYAWIEKDTRTGKLKADNNILIECLPTLNTYELIKDSPFLHNKINSRNELARLMYDVKHSNNYSCLLLTSATNNIRLFQELPNTFINMNYRQIGGYIKNRCRDTGSIRAFLATTDRPFFARAKELVNLGYVSDCISYIVTKGKPEIIEGADKKFIDQNIFKVLNNSIDNKKLRNKEGEDLSI